MKRQFESFAILALLLSCAHEPASIPADVMPISSLQNRSCVELKNLQLETKSKLVDIDVENQEPLGTAAEGIVMGQVLSPSLGAVQGLQATSQNAKLKQESQEAQSELQMINEAAQQKNCWQVIGE